MITLIGKELAKEGLEFIYYGSTEECESCRFKSSCIDNLEEGRKYKVLDIKENYQKCPIHFDEKVVPVTVELAEINLLTDSKSIFEGSTFTFEPNDCNKNCEFYDQCFPEGLFEKDKLIVLKNNGKHKGECEKGYRLTNLTLGFVQ